MRQINRASLLEILSLFFIDLFSPLTERWMDSPFSTTVKSKYLPYMWRKRAQTGLWINHHHWCQFVLSLNCVTHKSFLIGGDEIIFVQWKKINKKLNQKQNSFKNMVGFRMGEGLCPDPKGLDRMWTTGLCVWIKFIQIYGQLGHIKQTKKKVGTARFFLLLTLWYCFSNSSSGS